MVSSLIVDFASLLVGFAAGVITNDRACRKDTAGAVAEALRKERTYWAQRVLVLERSVEENVRETDEFRNQLGRALKALNGAEDRPNERV